MEEVTIRVELPDIADLAAKVRAELAAPTVPLEEALRRLLFVCSMRTDVDILVAARDVAHAVGLDWDPFEDTRRGIDNQMADVEGCAPVRWLVPEPGAIRLPPG